MKYTIVGSNGRTYGPAGADQIRQWIQQSRVESRTPVFVEGATNWTFLGLLPEFTPGFSETPPAIAPQRPGMAHAPPSGGNPLALWGFIFGLLSWTLCGCCLPFAILGLTFSIIALVQISSHAGTSDGRGLAIAGLVLSATNLVWSLGMTVFGLLNNSSQIHWNMVSGSG